MDTVRLVAYVVAGVILPIMGIYLLRVAFKLEPYEFMLIFMKPGVNKHKMIRGSSLEFEHKYELDTYAIKSDRLYRSKPGKLRKIYMKVRGVQERFFVVYQDKKKEPIAPPEVKVSAEILREVNESRALDKALRSEFHVPMDLKKILLIIGFLIVVIVAYVMVTGEVRI